MSKENSCCLISFCHSCLAHNPSFHFCIWDILVPLLSPGHLGTIPTRPISQEPGFVYLLPTRLKLSWNAVPKELVQLRHSHGALLFQVVPVPRGEAADRCRGSRALSPAPHFPWLGLKEHFPALPALSTTFVTERNNQTCSGFVKPWKRSWLDLDSGLEIIQAHPMDVTSPGHFLPVTSCNTLETL